MPDGSEIVPALTTVRLWINDARLHDVKHSLTSEADPENVNKIAAIIGQAGVPKSAASVRQARIKSYTSVTKEETVSPDGTKTSKTVATPQFSVEALLTPEWKGPRWPVCQPAQVKTFEWKPSTTRQPDFKRYLIIPDLQVAFLRDLDNLGELECVHDPAAIDVALQITSDYKFTKKVFLGDVLDLTEQSRFLQHDEFFRTTQPAFDEGAEIVRLFQEASPHDEESEFVPGNHERRLREYVQKNARAAFHLRPAMQTPADWPAFSIPWALAFDRLKVKYMGEWPGGETYLTQGLRVRHDLEKKSDLFVSTIYGHLHKLNHVRKTVSTREGRKTVSSICAGALCKVGTQARKLALKRTVVPSNSGYTDWQQGFVIVETDGRTYEVSLISIEDGQAQFRGKRYSSTRKKPFTKAK